MKYLGFPKITIASFKAEIAFALHLCKQKFKISINTSYSSPSNLLSGIPQGSILGQLLFQLYIKDFPQSVASTLLPYADNTCTNSTQSVIEIENQLI